MPAGIIVPAFPQRSPPRRLTAAARGGLRSAPDRRTRRALLHLSYSCASPFGPAILVTHDPERTLVGSCGRLTESFPNKANLLTQVRVGVFTPLDAVLDQDR